MHHDTPARRRRINFTAAEDPGGACLGRGEGVGRFALREKATRRILGRGTSSWIA
jgi:hypothetical protein